MPLLDGKVGLIVGIANDRSYAWHLAQALLEHGPKCAFPPPPGDRNQHRTRRGIDSLGVKDPWLTPMDAAKDEDLDAVFSKYAESFDRLDFVIHSIAFADRDLLQPGKFIATPRAAYLSAIDISAYTLLAMA